MSIEEITEKNDECLELKNIKYKTMLLSGIPIKETKTSNNLFNLDKFLEDEKTLNENEPWCKLNKTVKTKKLIEFASYYKNENNLNENDEQLLISFFKDCLDRKKLQRVKDVVYDKKNGSVKEIPALSYIKENKHFTFKNINKRISTLKSLTPKKVNSTIKNKIITQELNDSDSDDTN
jgi:hypothetical protein